MAKKKKTSSSTVEKWLGQIQAYERTFTKWESRGRKVLNRYKDNQGATARNTTSAKFNILWSNVQTLQAATFARVPKPDVSRRFRDNDPIGRIASLILERALDYEVQHYKDYRFAMKGSVLDRFLPGRGTCWIRYEPHFKALKGQPEDGLEITEDVDEPNEELDYECAPVDYVHWADFGHTVARTWDEVTAVWRNVYLSADAARERFDRELPMDAVPEEFKREQYPQPASDQYRALVYEIWDKETKKVYWISKSLGEVLDERDDPLGLEEFFPCPKPLYATLTNDTLEPVPDFTLYQDQARELDTLCDRIDGLVKALQVKGCYDASITALGRLFTEGENTNLVPVKNWQAFAEKQGLKGAIELVDLKPIYEALAAAYQAMEQIKNQIYEITGISDIVRGQTMASETATAQQLKGQYANLRLKSYQEQVAEFAAEAIQIKAQVICNKFDPQTILQISAANQISVADSDVLAVAPQLGMPQPQAPGQPPAPPPIATLSEEAKKQIVFEAALQLLLGERAKNPDAEPKNPMRDFRIEIESDSLVALDDQENKQQRMEFLQSQGQFIGNMEKMLLTAGPLAGALIVPLMEMWKFSAQAFKVGKNIEGSIDEATEKLKEIAAKPPQPQPNPDMVKIEAQSKMEQARQQFEMQKAQVEQQFEQQKMQADLQMKERELQMENQQEQRRIELQNASEQFRAQSQMDFEKWKAELDASTKITIAEISAKASVDQSLISAEQAANKEVEEDLTDGSAPVAEAKTKRRSKPLDRLSDMHKQTMEAHQQAMDMHGKTIDAVANLAKSMSRPKRVVRGPDGKVVGVEPA